MHRNTLHKSHAFCAMILISLPQYNPIYTYFKTERIETWRLRKLFNNMHLRHGISYRADWGLAILGKSRIHLAQIPKIHGYDATLAFFNGTLSLFCRTLTIRNLDVPTTPSPPNDIQVMMASITSFQTTKKISHWQHRQELSAFGKIAWILGIVHRDRWEGRNNTNIVRVNPTMRKRLLRSPLSPENSPFPLSFPGDVQDLIPLSCGQDPWMPGPPSPVLHILRDLGCLEPQVTKSHRNPVKALLNGCQVLWIRLSWLFCGEKKGKKKKERKRKK